MNWIALETEDTLNHLEKDSFQQTVLVFKHSTRCFISKMALRNFEQTFTALETPCYFLDLISYRNLSHQIASAFEVQHQSPQVLLIKEGKVIFHTSHENIDGETISKMLI